MIRLLVLLLLLAGAGTAAAAGAEEEAANVVFFSSSLPASTPKTCLGQDCFSTMFCYQGHRMWEAQWLFTELVGTLEFNALKLDAHAVRLDSAAEDEFSVKSVLAALSTSSPHTQQQRPQDRLRARLEAGGSSASLWYKLADLFSGSSSSSAASSDMTSRFQVHLSPFGTSCFQLEQATRGAANNKKKEEAEAIVSSLARITLEPKSRLYTNTDALAKALPGLVLGLALLVSARRLSAMPEFYYLSGASLGVCFAVSLLVMVVFHFTSSGSRHGDRDGGFKAHLGVAALFQAGVLFLRKSIAEYMADYAEYLVLYVVVSFCASLALIHYSLRTDDGVVLNAGVSDILHVFMSCVGMCLVVYTLLVSPRWQMLLVVLCALYTMVGARWTRWASSSSKKAKKHATATATTPRRESSSTAAAMKTPEQALDFIAHNHFKFVLQKFEDEDFYPEEEEEEASGEGSGEEDNDHF